MEKNGLKKKKCVKQYRGHVGEGGVRVVVRCPNFMGWGC